MGIEVYATCLKNLLDEPTEKFLHLFSAARREKILRYRFAADRNRTIFAELLARSVVAEKFSRTVEEISIARDENGKPHLSTDDLQISISHSKNWAAVSVGDVASGVDVEEDSSAALDIARNFFPPHEYAELRDLPDDVRDEKFLRLWTLKESYFKLSGDENFLRVDCNKIVGKSFIPRAGVVVSCCSEKFADLPPEIFLLNSVTKRTSPRITDRKQIGG